MGGQDRDTASGPGARDLSEDSRFFIDLLDGTYLWRERVVEELTFESGTHVRVQAAYQIDVPPEMMALYVDLSTTSSVKALIPVTTREKVPLLNLDPVGPGGRPAHLVTRNSSAALQARYLEALAAISPARALWRPLLSTGLFEAICVFSPDRWRENRRAYPTREAALRSFLEGGSRAGLVPTMADIGRWSEISREVGSILKAFGDGIWREDSSSHDVLLAVPHLDPPPAVPDDVDRVLGALLAAVREAATCGDALILGVLSEYGHRYELIIESELDVLEPNTIKVSEDRPLALHRGWSRQRYSMSDARSAHFEARVRDPNVTFSKFGVRDPRGGRIGIGLLESARRTRETLSLYTSDPDRPLAASVEMKFRPALHLLGTALLLATLNLAAAITAALEPDDGVLLDRTAILAVPTTIAAAFALTREQTALASRLMKPSRALLLMTTAVLWVVVLVRIAVYDPPTS